MPWRQVTIPVHWPWENSEHHKPSATTGSWWDFHVILTISRGFGRHQVSCSGGKVAAAFPTIRDTSMTLGIVVFRDTFFRKVFSSSTWSPGSQKRSCYSDRRGKSSDLAPGNLWPLKDCKLGRFVTWGGGFCEGLGGLFLEGGAVPMCGSLGSQRFDNEFNWFYRRERLRKDIW